MAFTLILMVGLLVQLHMNCITSGFPAIQESYHSLERIPLHGLPREELSQGQSERALCASRASLRERDSFNRAL